MIVTGRGFDIYSQSFRIFAAIIILLSYLSAKEIAIELKVNKSRWIFIGSILSGMVYPIVLMGEMLSMWGSIHTSFEFHIFDVIAFFGVTYIAVKYPETLLISKTQIIRVHELQKTFGLNDHVDIPVNPPNDIFKTTKDYILYLKQSLPELFKPRTTK
jgi:hypothetical protein